MSDILNINELTPIHKIIKYIMMLPIKTKTSYLKVMTYIITLDSLWYKCDNVFSALTIDYKKGYWHLKYSKSYMNGFL
jgi:hypothetical protein